MKQWNPSTLQIKTNQSSADNEFRFYNMSAFPGRIAQVVIKFSNLSVIDASKLMFLGGASAVTAVTGGTAGTWNSTAKTLTWTPSPSDNFTYFAFYQDGKAASGTNYLASEDAIVVTYEVSTAVATTTTIDASGITNTDVYTNTAAGSLVATVKAGTSTISGASVTWASSNTDVATIDANGAVTLVAAGTTTITANYAGVANTYQPSSATYELTVTDSTPFIGSIFIFNTDAGLTELGITKPESGAGTDLDTNEDYSIGNVTMNITHGGTNTRVWNSNGTTDLRVYSNGFLTFTVPSGYAITRVTFTGSAIGLSGLTNGVWTASDDPVNTVTFSSTGTSKINTITVEYEANTTPMISAENVNIDYSAESGNISYSITNPVAGTSLTASTDATWITLGTITSEAVPFTCSANEVTESRTATVTLTYGSVTKEVTVTQAAAPLIYRTIPDIFAAATSTETEVNINFGGWVVSGVSGKNAYLTDNQGHGLIIYTDGHGFAVNDVLTGTVSCKLQLFRGSAELTNLTSSTEGLSVAHNGTVAEVSIAMENLAGVNTGALVSYENLTCSVTSGKYYLTDGTTTLQVYNTLYAFEALEAGKTYNITGVYQQYSGTKEILPRSAADIVEVVEPSITVDPAIANHAAADVEGTLDITYENLSISDMTDFDVQFCDAEGNGLDAAPGWIEALVAEAEGREGYVVSYIMDANTGDARTAYFKVYAMDDDTNLVYSNLVTVNQAAYVAPSTEGTIVFGNNGTKINSASVTGDDSMGNTWTITSEGTTSYTQNTAYSQVGKGTQPATSITFTTTLPAEATITSFEAKFGGFSDTAGDVTLKVGENTVGTGSLNGTADVIVSNTSTATGTTLTVTVTNIAKGVKCYYISYEVEVEESIKVKLNASGYATFASTQVLDFTDTEGYTAWAVTAVNGSTITFSQITGPVPAGTGVLLKGTASTEYTLATGTEGTAPAGNLLEGVVAPKVIEAAQYYGLSGAKFVKVNAGTVPAGKALLPASVVNGTGVKTLTFNFDEDATAIKAIDNGQLTTDGVIYNVAGQRLSKMQKGINIVNGRKVLY